MGSVRIASGKLRGRRVLTPAGDTTRPLLSRLRKTLADILRPDLQGARVLDLFGGSGAIAFELLSNGADNAEIVELHAPAAELLRQNAARLGLQSRVQVHCGDAIAVIERLAQSGTSFDIILVAPPYGYGLQQKALTALARSGLLKTTGLILAQRDRREPCTEPIVPFSLMQTRSYGRTIFEFFNCGAD